MTKRELVDHKIYTPEQLKPLLAIWRFKGNRIVFTNGCFDLMHLGHIDYLAKAAGLGDILLVGVNTDASVSRVKGPSRPINNELSRTRILASLFFVNGVILFDEPTPYDLIKAIRPDILVKGADWNKEAIGGYDIVTGSGGKVETLPFLDGYSTTSLEQKIIRYHQSGS